MSSLAMTTRPSATESAPTPRQAHSPTKAPPRGWCAPAGAATRAPEAPRARWVPPGGAGAAVEPQVRLGPIGPRDVGHEGPETGDRGTPTQRPNAPHRALPDPPAGRGVAF